MRSCEASGATPRSGRLPVESLPRSGTDTTPNTSGEIIGSLFACADALHIVERGDLVRHEIALHFAS